MEAHFIVRNTEVLANCLAHLKQMDARKIWSVKISEKQVKRSTAANALYWVWLTYIGKDLGYQPTELHEALKAKILGVIERKTVFGNIVNEPRSTTSLTTKEFTEYLNAVQAFAMSLGIVIPSHEHFGITPFIQERR